MDWRAQRDAVEESFRSTAKREGGKYRIVCPFCTSSKTGRPDYSMSVASGTGLYYCHRCEHGGRLREAPDPYADVSVEQTIEVTEPPDGFIPLGHEPGLSAESLEDARAYARKRGLDEAMCREMGVGAVLDGYYAGRIIIPMLNDERDWVGYVARDWTGRAQKPYLYPRGMSREHLFNESALWERTEEPVLVVEGVLDTVPYWPDAVAVLGKPSHTQKESLMRAQRPVVLVLDGDAWREAHALCMELRLFGRTAGWVRLPPKKDPDEVPTAWLRGAARLSLEEPL
jgi:hypothetical protein